MTVNEKSFLVGKMPFTRRRFPLVPIIEDTNILKSAERGGALGTQSAKKQHPTESKLHIRKALQRRSCAPSFRTTESISPVNANGPTSDNNKPSETNHGISPAACSLWESQDCSARKPQESSAESLGITFKSQWAVSRRRRRSRVLWQEETSETEVRDEDSEFCQQSTSEAQDGRIVESEKKTSLGSSLPSLSRTDTVSEFALLLIFFYILSSRNSTMIFLIE